MKYEIEVTQEDIDNGAPCKARFCPIALAIKRKIHFEYFAISQSTFDYGPEENRKYGETPAEVARFISLFDCVRDSVKPFSFELELDDAM